LKVRRGYRKERWGDGGGDEVNDALSSYSKHLESMLLEVTRKIS